jgi:hypothetical protein
MDLTLEQMNLEPSDAPSAMTLGHLSFSSWLSHTVHRMWQGHGLDRPQLVALVEGLWTSMVGGF